MNEISDRLDALLMATAPDDGPALVLRVEGATTAWAGARGRRAMPTGPTAAADDAFRIASVTKTFTAAAVLALEERGSLSLETPAVDLLPDEPAALLRALVGDHPRGVTVGRLLDHRSGLYDAVSDDRFKAELHADPQRRWAPLDVLDWARRHGRPYFEPGTGFHYTDTGFILAGLLLEHLTGQPLGVMYRSLLLDPLGLSDTFLEVDQRDRLPADLTHPYWDDFDLLALDPSSDWAGGGLISTSADLARFFRGLLTGRLLGPARLAAMTSWSPTVTWRPGGPVRYDRYGLGLGGVDIGGAELLGHTGFLGAFAYYAPALDTTFAGTWNRVNPNRRPWLEAAVAAVRS